MKNKAFTLIELLVVIAIIALLLSIVMPGLNMAKRKAASAACLSNARQMSMAWYMYQEEQLTTSVVTLRASLQTHSSFFQDIKPRSCLQPVQPCFLVQTRPDYPGFLPCQAGWKLQKTGSIP